MARNELQSPLLHLAVEVRHEIYANILGGHVWRVTEYLSSHTFRATKRSRATHELALLSTCCQIYQETASVRFVLNTFTCRFDAWQRLSGRLAAAEHAAAAAGHVAGKTGLA